MKYFYQSIPLIKTLFYLYIIISIGIIKGIISIILLNKIYNYIMNKFFNLHPFSPGDYTFMWNTHEETYNLIAIMLFDKLDKSAVKELIINKGFRNLKKLRSKIVYKFFDWWWQEMPLDYAINEVFIPYDKCPILITKEDIINYCTKELDERFDIHNGIPFRIIFINNEKSQTEFKNILMFKFDHVFTDGLGFISLIATLADNYNVNLYPQGMRKKLSMIQTISTIIMLPFLLIYPIYINLLCLINGNSPWKTSKAIIGKPIIALSPQIDFKEISNISKKLGMTFNDFIMSTFSTAMKKYCRNNFSRTPEKLMIVTPIGNRGLPNNINEISVSNDSTAMISCLPLVDDCLKQYNIVSKEMAKNIRNLPMGKIFKFIADSLNLYFPVYISQYIMKTSNRLTDITFSNIPGPRESLLYCGCKCMELMPFFTPGFSSAFVAIVSYVDSFRVSIVYDKNLEMDPNLLMNIFLDEVDYMKRNYESIIKND